MLTPNILGVITLDYKLMDSGYARESGPDNTGYRENQSREVEVQGT